MFKDIKLQSKTNVLKNYKNIFLPVLLYEIFLSLAISIFDIGFFNGNYFLKSLLLFILLISIDFVVLPIIVIIYYKISICILDNKKVNINEVTPFLKFNNILKITAVSFVPNLINFSYSLVKYFKAEFNSVLFYYLLVFILLTVRYYVEYKFFICNYSLVLMNSSSKEILNFSFKTMKHKMLNYIKYDISFILWYLVITIIGIIGVFILKLVNIEATQFRFAISSVFGVMLFYRPYRFFSDLLYAKKLSQTKNNSTAI